MSQPKIAKLLRMKLDGFSRDRLQEVLRNLGIDVVIELHRRDDGGIGTLRVMQTA